MSQPHIACVDDEASIRDLYAAALPLGGFTPVPLKSGKELFEALREEKIDLILLDLMLEGEDGFRLLADLKEDPKCSSIPIIIVSARTGEVDKVKGLNLGADDYISKPFSVAEMLARIKANLRRAQREDNSSKKVYKDLSCDSKAHEICLNGVPLSLAKKEFSLLSYFISNPNKVLSKDEILSAVWGIASSGIETRTIDIHVSKIRAKIQGSQAGIDTVRGIGYVLR